MPYAYFVAGSVKPEQNSSVFFFFFFFGTSIYCSRKWKLIVASSVPKELDGDNDTISVQCAVAYVACVRNLILT